MIHKSITGSTFLSILIISTPDKLEKCTGKIGWNLKQNNGTIIIKLKNEYNLVIDKLKEKKTTLRKSKKKNQVEIDILYKWMLEIGDE